MWNQAVANFQEMIEEEKGKVPHVEEYAKMLYSIQIHQVMNKVAGVTPERAVKY